jgi:hypothetical protein
MANMSWTKSPDSVAQGYDARHGQNLSSSLFRWATFVVEELYYLDDLDSDWNNYLNHAGSHNPDIIDMAHGRWATGSAITALDLCAAALGRQYCNWTGRNEFDLRDFDQQTTQTLTRRGTLPPSALAWVDGVLADPRYQIVLNIRHSLTHSRLPRHLRISLGGEPKKDRMDFKITINGNQIQIGVRDLVLQSKDLAGQHVDRFLRVFDVL